MHDHFSKARWNGGKLISVRPIHEPKQSVRRWARRLWLRKRIREHCPIFEAKHDAYALEQRARSAFWLIRLNRKRVGNQAGLLAFVAGERADGGAGAGFAAGVRDFGAEKRTQARFDERPRAHGFRFFLTPDELGVFRKWLEHFAQLFFRQRI